jgi:chromosome partitioning protein
LRSPGAGPEKEQVVRKLLVASQKGGVGKTTSSMNLAAATAMTGARVLLLDADPLSSISSSLNLAQHAQRQSLREAGLDLPGLLVPNVIPELDVLSPYEDGGCSDEDLDRLLAALAIPSLEETYDCLVVDTPPFMGANPGQLLASCDQFVLVMRAEPMAYRMLPAFLELVQRSRGQAIAMRGILLTLPEGEVPGGRWEREMRGRFGSRILPQVIPFDDAVSQAVLFGQIACHTNKSCPAAVAYHALVETMAIAEAPGARRLHRSSEPSLALSALRLAAQAIGPRPARAASVAVPVAPPPPVPAPMHGTLAPTRPAPSGVRRVVAVGSDEPATPSAPPRRRLTPITAIPVVRPSDGRARSWPRPVVTVPGPSVPPSARPPAPARTNTSFGKALLWVLLGVICGIGMRFVPLSDNVMPILVGLSVAALVLLILKPSQTQQPRTRQSSATRKPIPRRSEGRPDPSKRLSGLKRRITPTRNLQGD